MDAGYFQSSSPLSEIISVAAPKATYEWVMAGSSPRAVKPERTAQVARKSGAVNRRELGEGRAGILGVRSFGDQGRVSERAAAL